MLILAVRDGGEFEGTEQATCYSDEHVVQHELYESQLDSQQSTRDKFMLETSVQLRTNARKLVMVFSNINSEYTTTSCVSRVAIAGTLMSYPSDTMSVNKMFQN